MRGTQRGRPASGKHRRGRVKAIVGEFSAEGSGFERTHAPSDGNFRIGVGLGKGLRPLGVSAAQECNQIGVVHPGHRFQSVIRRHGHRVDCRGLNGGQTVVALSATSIAGRNPPAANSCFGSCSNCSAAKNIFISNCRPRGIPSRSTFGATDRSAPALPRCAITTRRAARHRLHALAHVEVDERSHRGEFR